MSSLLEKQERDCSRPPKGVLKRRFSFDRIKCSAAYPLLGSILKKDSSFIHLLKNAMTSSRAFVQKPAIALVIPAVHILCVAIAFLASLIRQLNGGVSFEKLDQFIAEINQLKSKRQSSSVQKEIRQRIERVIEKDISSSTEHSQCERLNGETLCCDNIIDECIQSNKRRLLRISSFSCIFLVYLQFVVLIYLLGNTHLRLGLVFLLVCALAVTYLVLKISFITKSHGKKQHTRRHKRTKQELTLRSFAQFGLRAAENYLQQKKSL
jgi:hypothetical protein